MTTRAYCFASGHIGFTNGQIPSGALPIAITEPGEDARAFRDTIEGLCRLAYDNVTRFVPGLPEAEDEDAAYLAFEQFGETVRNALQRAARPLPKERAAHKPRARTRR